MEPKETYKCYAQSPHGYLVARYCSMKERVRNRPNYINKTVDFTFQEFENTFDTPIFREMLQAYLASGKNLSLAPSIDRIDNNKGYSLDNIRWVTQGENSRKGAKYESSGHMKKIKQLTSDLKIVRVWGSAKEVYLTLGYDRGSLCCCLKGRSKTSYGYKWQYDN